MEDTALFDALDAVYAAALDRFHWPDSLRAVAAGLGASVAMLLEMPASGHGWHIFAACGLAEPLVDTYNTHWHSHDPFIGDALPAGNGDVAIRLVHVDDHRGPFTNFFSEPAGCRSGLLAVANAGGLAAAFWRPGDRRFGQREEELLRRLWPHIVRARQIQETAWDATATSRGAPAEAVLDLWPIGVIGFSSDGRQNYANRAALGIVAVGDGLTLAADGPLAAIPRDTKALREMIRQVAAAGSGPDWIRLHRPSGARPYEVAVCRVESATAGATVMLFIAEPDRPVTLNALALRRLHGLTDLEIRIAECVALGMAASEIAVSQHLTAQTARWYVQQVRQKLGATSQSELVRILIRGVTGLTIRPPAARQKN